MKKLILVFLLFLSIIVNGQDFETGKNLFNMNCASCHKMDKKVVGPALKDVVALQGRDWTKEWIYNSSALIESGDSHANEVWNEYNKMAMPPYNWLEDSELESIVTYLEDYTKVKEEKKAELQASQPIVTTANVVQSSTPTYIWILVIMSVVLVALSLYVILLAMRTIAQHAARYQSINKHLMNRLGLDTRELEKEFDEYLEGEVNKKVEDKIKIIKKEINEKLNKFK